MRSLRASETRIPAQTFRRIIRKNEPVRIIHRTEGSVVLISEEEYQAFCDWEDFLDTKEAEEALREFRESGEEAIPWEQVKKEAGL